MMPEEPSARDIVESLEIQAQRQEAAGDHVGLLETLARLAEVHNELQDEPKARRTLNLAYQVAQSLEDQYEATQALHHVGFLHHLQGGWDRALEMYHRVLGLHRAANDLSGAAATLGSIAEVLQGKGEFRKALERYEESLALKTEIQDEQGLALTWNNIGTVKARMGDIPEALEAFERSLQMQERLGDILGKAATLTNIGSIHQRQGHWHEALQRFQQSLGFYEAAGNTLGMATTLNALGLIQRHVGDLDGAYQSYARAKDLMLILGDDLRVTIPIHNMAMIHEERGEYRDALRLMEEVISIDKRIGHPDLRQDLETFGRIREKLDRQRDQRLSG